MRTVRIPDDVLFRSFGQEMVLLNLRTGQYHGLNDTGGRMLEVLIEVADMDKATRLIATEYGCSVGEVSRDMAELCAALSERALVQIEEAGGSGDVSS
jgi:hypothetical protein